MVQLAPAAGVLFRKEEVAAAAVATALTTTDPTQFRRLMGNWATGVTVVTSQGPGGPHGMTANAFLSVSLEPPLVLISVGHTNDSHAIIKGSRRFAVSMLSDAQEALAVTFATRRPDPENAFLGVPYTLSPAGLPWLEGALGCLECEVQAEVEAQDHTLFLGRVCALREGNEGPALIYFRSSYTAPR